MEIFRRRDIALLAFLILAAPLHAVETGGPEEAGSVPAIPVSISAPAALVPDAGPDLSLPPAINGTAISVEQPAASAGAEAATIRAAGVAPESAQPQAAPSIAGAQAAETATPGAQAQISAAASQPEAAAAPIASGELPEASAHLAARLTGAVHGVSAAAPAGKAESFEQSSISGGRLFDGLRARAQRTIAPVAARLVSSRYARFLPARLLAVAQKQADRSGPPAPPAPPSRDRFGGPLPSAAPSGFRSNFIYGLKAGGVLLGLSTVLQLTLGPWMTSMPWQLHAPHTLLQFMGRVELLTTLGPTAIMHALRTSPVGFFLLSLPWATFYDEIVYRGLQFVLIFSPLAAVRFLSTKFSGILNELPDLYGFRSGLQRLLRVASHASDLAFPIAAVLTSFSFATAHFPLWGASPYSFSVHFLLGLGLTYIAYKKRSLTASWAAHLVVNALPLFGVAAALALGSAPIAAIYALALSVGSIIYLVRSLRAQSQAKSWTGFKRLLPMLVIAACLAGVGLNAIHRAPAARTQDTVAFSVGQKSALPAPAPMTPPAAVAVAPQDTSALTETQVSALIKPSVVKITVPLRPGEVAIGSGFIVSKKGLLVTNNHVVNSAKPGTKVEVELVDGQTLEGTVVAANADRDIALVQLPALKNADGTPADWPFLKIADMSTVHEGDHVVAAGHPLDLPYSVSHGIVSGLGQRGSIYVQQLQTDAAINHGNSGGPLVNMRGEVIGINTSIAAPTPESGSIGIGFSITADGIKASLAQYAAQGNINSADLGIIINAEGPQMTPGVQIEVVRPGSAADKAGLRAGDVIIGVNGHPLAVKRAQAIDTLAASLAKRKPGDQLNLDVYRRGAKDLGTFSVQLGDKKPS